jgi:hypothetical protein
MSRIGPATNSGQPSELIPQALSVSFRDFGDYGAAERVKSCCSHIVSGTARARPVVNLAQPVNKENSMQAVAPFVMMILVLAVIFYLAHWDANRGKIKR